MNLPIEFKEYIETLLGKEAHAFFDSHLLPVPVSIRLHPQKGLDLFPEEEQIPWCTNGKYLKERPVFTLDPLFHAGCYYVQEAGSMLLEKLLQDVVPQFSAPLLLDLCASPGGKSTHLLSLFPEESILISNEIIPGRNKILRHNIAKWGSPNTIITQNEAKEITSSGIKFDIILVDAPCSGEGLFRKDPEATEQWSPEQVQVCSKRQTNILNDIIPSLHSGGYLLYSTCTYETSENDDQIEKLINDYNFESVMPAPPPGIISTKYGWQAYPHKVKSEGFYCSLLKKPGKLTTDSSKSSKIKGQRASETLLKNWIQDPGKTMVFSQGEFINGAKPRLLEALNTLSRKCYIRMAGIPLGQMKGNDFVPSAELALSTKLETDLPKINLEHSDAINYLRCENITVESDRNGWHLIQFQNHPLGWAKKINQRWNNYFPKEWRILMEKKSDSPSKKH